MNAHSPVRAGQQAGCYGGMRDRAGRAHFLQRAEATGLAEHSSKHMSELKLQTGAVELQVL